MDEYPNPDEEYELMYAEELEMLRDSEDITEAANVVRKKSLPAKRSLDFSSPAAKLPTLSKQVPLAIEPDISLTPNLPVTNNKRSAQDLFGDIGDIDFDNIEQPSKRQKTEEEIDLELIDKIVESRKMRQMLLEPASRLQSKEKSGYSAKENMSLDFPRWPFLPLTNSQGLRVYVRQESEEQWENSLDMALYQGSLHSSYASTWEEARKILEEKQQQLSLSQPVLPDTNPSVNCETVLWVDKYRPKSYVDLLSDEPVNRALLHWLHLWDKVVFNKEIKTIEPQQRTQFVKRTGQFELKGGWRGRKGDEEGEVDKGGRPRRRVALLCGPPGVGKTTLAHLLARLAGYRPVELNASDERSTEAFRNALQSATLMQSVLDKDRRPNCLILDEIDGAPLPTVELLVKWCTATGVEGKKKAKIQPLKRPVIAICNDLYATSLRPLRAVSLIIHVPGVSLPRLTARLSRLSRTERIHAPPHVLAALAARTQGDVRAAIQLLSFVRAKGKQLNMSDIENAAIGTKDCAKSLMQALQAVFTVNDKDNSAVLRTIQAAGDYDRMVDGIFENYLTSRVDARLNVACETLSWLRLYDEISTWTVRSQNYSLYGMLPMCVSRCHVTLASRTPQRISFPMKAHEVSKQRNEIEAIVQSVYVGARAGVRAGRRALRLSVLPLLPALLAPPLRSNNIQLCSEAERATIRTVAGAMCDYGLQYEQRRGEDGLYSFVLEPDIHKVAFFGNEERMRPPPAVRAAIAREHQLELIRRQEGVINKTSNEKENKRNSTENQAQKEKEVKEVRIPNHLQRLEPKQLTKAAPQVHKDFFGRIVLLSQVQRSDPVADVISSSSVFYQYREGFNNAVRRNVRTKDLL